MTNKASWTCTVSNTPVQPWFNWICFGMKVCEGRVFTGKWRQMKVGDILVIINGADRINPEINTFTAEIVSIMRFVSWEEMLKDVEIRVKTVPQMSYEKALSFYNALPIDHDEIVKIGEDGLPNGVCVVEFKFSP